VKVKCEACGREFNKVYWKMDHHLCRSCQRLGRDACVKCGGWCCNVFKEGRIPLLDDEKERFGVKGKWLYEPCRWKDSKTGYCMLERRFRAAICHEFVCKDLVESARAKLTSREGR